MNAGGRERVSTSGQRVPVVISPGLVIRNLCNDELIGTGAFPRHTGLVETTAGQSGFPPVISKMLVY